MSGILTDWRGLTVFSRTTLSRADEAVAALKSYWQGLSPDVQADGKVIAAKDKRKADLTREITADEIPY